MKKTGLLIVAILIIAGGVYMLWSVFRQYKDMEIDDIIWTDGYGEDSRIYLYRGGKTENIGNISLKNFSKKGETQLVGVQNLYSNSKGFKGIVTYNITTKEVNEILACDKIYDFLGEGNHEFGGNIQMTDDGKYLYFLCDDKMISYDVEKDQMEILFETWCESYILNEQGTCLFFCDRPALCRYDLSTKERDEVALINGIYSFAISKDEKMLVYRDCDNNELCLFRMDTKEKKKLVELDYIWGAVYISDDNRYVLYTDYKESFVPTNRKIGVYVIDLETGKRRTIYKGTYQDNIGNVLW